jgi:outer membrane cobalamin receptor
VVSFLCLSALFGLAVPVGAQPSGSLVTGTVASPDGQPIRGASITLSGRGGTLTASSDRTGHFEIAHVAPGAYGVRASASGYSTLSGQTVDVKSDAATMLTLTLPKAQVAALTVIGTVTANGTSTISTAPAPSLTISTQPYAQQGVTRVSDILSNQLSTTVYPVIGGGLNAPAVVALRGPDPSETLVDVDGHQVNNGSTGDFDLSLLDPADLQSLQVVYGIAPGSLFGPNTLGGALNVQTLEPTAQPHTLVRFTGGNYDTFGETLAATGTEDRLGYAFSYHRVTSGGQLSDYFIPTTDGTGTAPVGNDMDATSLIGKLRYAFGNSNGFVGITFHDQSVYRDLSATLSSVQTPAAAAAEGSPGQVGDAYSNFSGSGILSNSVAYGIDAQIPLGRPDADHTTTTTLIFRHQTSLVNQSVFGDAAGTSPYLYNDRDLIGDDTLELDHVVPHGLLSLKASLTNESLLTEFAPGVIFADAALRQQPGAPGSVSSTAALRVTPLDAGDALSSTSTSQQHLAQTERWVALLYQDDVTSNLHYSFATYYSDYSTFGTALDPRVGFVWTPTAASALRVSVGNTFQSPQLPTFIVPPTLPAPVDGYVSIGNPHATAEKATSYDLGYEHIFHVPEQVHVALDLYRTDLHNGVATYFSPTPCPANAPPAVWPTCLSFPVNVTQEVYQGLELRGDVALQAHLALHAAYDIDSVFTKSYPANAADDVALYEQSLGVPLHKISLTLAHDKKVGLSYYIGLLYEGRYNELNLPPFATLRAGVTWHVHGYDVGLYGTNLTNVYNFPLTQAGGGVPYGGLPGSGFVPTDAIPLPGPQITFSIARHT